LFSQGLPFLLAQMGKKLLSVLRVDTQRVGKVLVSGFSAYIPEVKEYIRLMWHHSTGSEVI